MAASAFIEDDNYRLSLLSAQPLGAGSLDVGKKYFWLYFHNLWEKIFIFSGWLEVFLDRRLMQDDNRGLFQGVTDNKITPNNFAIVLERLQPGKTKSVSASFLFFLSENTLHIAKLHIAHYTNIQSKNFTKFVYKIESSIFRPTKEWLITR